MSATGKPYARAGIAYGAAHVRRTCGTEIAYGLPGVDLTEGGQTCTIGNVDATLRVGYATSINLRASYTMSGTHTAIWGLLLPYIPPPSQPTRPPTRYPVLTHSPRRISPLSYYASYAMSGTHTANWGYLPARFLGNLQY
eukprot:1736479-Rhodomonas_salina.4